jgi:hypothetical protein
MSKNINNAFGKGGTMEIDREIANEDAFATKDGNGKRGGERTEIIDPNGGPELWGMTKRMETTGSATE